MTFDQLYVLSGRTCMFLFGCFGIAAALFCAFIQIIHYELIQTAVPTSRRGRFGLPPAFAIMGIACVVAAFKVPADQFLNSGLDVFGCMSPFMLVCSGIVAWNLSVELRHAFQLWHQRNMQ